MRKGYKNKARHYYLARIDVLNPTFDLAMMFGQVEWRANNAFADAEKYSGTKLPEISLYLLGLEVATHFKANLMKMELAPLYSISAILSIAAQEWRTGMAFLASTEPEIISQ